jgi:hypothetical protein
MLSQRVVAEKRTDREAITNPVRARCAVNAKNLFHGAFVRAVRLEIKPSCGD